MFAVILLPNFRLQALLRHRPELWAKPVAVVDDANAPQNAPGTSKKQPASQVVELTPAAELAGVQIGMTPTQALARCLSLQILQRAPAAERSVAEALLSVACSGSAYVEQTTESICVLDLQGTRVPNEEPLAGSIAHPVADRNATAHTGLGLASDRIAFPAQSPRIFPSLMEAAAPQGMKADRFQQWGIGLLRQLKSIQLTAHVGIAQNPDLALLAAQSVMVMNHARATTAKPSSRSRQRRKPIPPEAAAPSDQQNIRCVGDSTAFLSDLPLEALSPSAQVRGVLHGWGITRLGEFMQLRRSDVTARLGVESGQLWDRANGKTQRLLKLVRNPERYEEAFDFEHEIDTAQPLLFLLRRFVDQLSARLGITGLVAAEMALTLPLGNGSCYERTFKIPSPSANPDLLFRILDTHFENLRLDVPPTGLRLSITPVKPEHQQFRLFENAMRDPNRFAETLARIMSLVGSGNVGIPEMKATHLPDQFSLKMPDFAGERGGFGGSERTVSQRASSGDKRSKSAIIERLPAKAESQVGLPLRRFRPPLDAQVHANHGRPSYVVSEKAHGSVAEALGPYRLSGDWWENEDAWTVEEWDIEMADGGIYRISRHGDTWKVEGCYDV